jgi:hypothetical protein
MGGPPFFPLPCDVPCYVLLPRDLPYFEWIGRLPKLAAARCRLGAAHKQQATWGGRRRITTLRVLRRTIAGKVQQTLAQVVWDVRAIDVIGSVRVALTALDGRNRHGRYTEGHRER